MGKTLRKLAAVVETVSRHGPRPLGLAPRVALGLVALGLVAVTIFAARWYVDPARFVDPSGLRLEGEWEFSAGASETCTVAGRALPCRAVGRGWEKSSRVEVPKPLAARDLPDEIWYRTRVRVPENLLGEDLSLSLGSIKGPHAVWINGELVGSGGEVAFALHRLQPLHLGRGGELDLVVQVGRSASPYRGIVHFNPVQVGRSRILLNQERDYQFQTIAKPLLPVAFKLSLFLIFAALFVFMPLRREYLWFAGYTLASGLSAFGYWRLNPFYEDYLFRNSAIFFFEVLATAMVPLFVAEMLRFNRRGLGFAAAWSAFLFLVPLIAGVIAGESKWIPLFQASYRWMPWVALLPAMVVVSAVAIHLGFVVGVRHRAAQLGVLALCLGVAFFHKTANAGAFFQFLVVRYPELLDAGIFTALGALMVADFRGLQGVYLRSKEMLPGDVARLAASGAQHALVKSDAVIVVVDAVGYTKQLAVAKAEERDRLNQVLKDSLQPIVTSLGGEKISDTGDGSVYRWGLGQEEDALYAASRIADLSLFDERLRFRVGVASGSVTCHFKSAEFSFLGEPINRAARLQSAAEAGTVLVDESVEVPAGMTVSEPIPYLVKGQKFRARILRLSRSVLRAA